MDADTRNPWYFPSLGQYTTLLESHGFRVHIAHHFDRPTKLPEGKDGVKYWRYILAIVSLLDSRLKRRTKPLPVSAKLHRRRSGVRMHFMQITNACESLQRRFQNFRLIF